MSELQAIIEWDGRDFVRFWTKVSIGNPDECWPWTGATGTRGYGQFRIGGREGGILYPAPRVAWAMSHCVLDIPLFVLHKCDNPPCVNPTHLFLGTNADNVGDMVAKGRNCHGAAMSAALHGKMPRGERHHNVLLTTEKVLLIRSLYAAGESTWSSLGRQFGVSPSCIQAILERRTWKHV